MDVHFQPPAGQKVYSGLRRKSSNIIRSRVVAATLLILISLTIPAIAQDDLTDAQYEELSRALDMSVEEIRALNLAPDDL